MEADARAEGQDALGRARETIAQQAEEIARLRRRLADGRAADELRESLSLAATAGTIASPVTHSRLLEMIVATAADVIGARAASLFLIDQAAEELVFEVALGEKAEEAKKFRVPLGHGIAGLVAASGQPMAIADTESESRDAADIAAAIGYTPQNILCVPLVYEEQVIGVLELLDKEGAASFSPSDMESLGLFANQAAIAIEQSRHQQDLAALMGGALQSLAGVPDYQRQALGERAKAFAADLEEDASYRESLDLARLVQEVTHQGTREADACAAILRGFVTYLRSRPPTDGQSGAPPW